MVQALLHALNALLELFPVQQALLTALNAPLDLTQMIQVPLRASCAQWHHILICQAPHNAYNVLLEIIRIKLVQLTAPNVLLA